MSFSDILQHTFAAYGKNFKLISFFSVPFAIVFLLSLMLENFVSFSGIFLRYGSIQADLSSFDAIILVALFLISLSVFSFAVVGINLAIKSQRTLKRLSHYENEKIEYATIRMFTIFLTSFVIILLTNLFLYDYHLTSSLGLLIATIISIGILFVPQALVIDDLGLRNSIYMSVSVIFRRFTYVLMFLVIAAFLISINTKIFLEISSSFPIARYFAVLINAVLILPFLEVLKTQIYLSKYSVLR
ncbi:MAG: hypothetical protein AABY04_04640 [Candidatus Micrarchaeota archaeon]